jgi:Flp pilus assembly protein TadG
VKKITAIGDQKGVAAVEFAIILFFFLAIFVFGMIDISVLLYNQNVITNASREGARARTTGATNIQQIVEDYCRNNLYNLGGPNAFDWTYGSAVSGPDGQNHVTVTVKYRYDFLFASFLGFNNKIMTAKTVMRMEE